MECVDGESPGHNAQSRRRPSSLLLQFGMESPTPLASPKIQSPEWQPIEERMGALDQVQKLQQKYEEIARTQNAMLTEWLSSDPDDSQGSTSFSSEEINDSIESMESFEGQESGHEDGDGDRDVLMVNVRDIELAGRQIRYSPPADNFPEAVTDLMDATSVVLKMVTNFILQTVREHPPSVAFAALCILLAIAAQYMIS